MSLYKVVFQHGGNGSFGCLVALAVDARTKFCKGVYKGFGSDEIPEAKPRGQNLGKCANIEHNPRGIGTYKRSHRAAIVVEFMVVVVFKNGKAMLSGQFE